MPTSFDLITAEVTRKDYDLARDHSQEQARTRLDGRQIPDFGVAPDKEAARYHVNESLRTALNMALNSGSPLLLTGEPGTGKTMVAHYLAYYFDLALFRYVVRSDSTAEHLRYDFDAIAYLRDANERLADREAGKPRRRRDDPAYLSKHALWQAYQHSRDHGPCVLLIDEIDKAPRDFPNDLLLELDRHRFPHPFDAGVEIAANPRQPPIVIVTSNAERRLPNAFLRRCIYHHIKLDHDLLEAAVGAHDRLELEPAVIATALDRVMELRRFPNLNKAPSTAEVLVWLTLLSAHGVDHAKLKTQPLGKLLFRNALIKDREDLERLKGA